MLTLTLTLTPTLTLTLIPTLTVTLTLTLASSGARPPVTTAGDPATRAAETEPQKEVRLPYPYP